MERRTAGARNVGDYSNHLPDGLVDCLSLYSTQIWTLLLYGLSDAFHPSLLSWACRAKLFAGCEGSDRYVYELRLRWWTRCWFWKKEEARWEYLGEGWRLTMSDGYCIWGGGARSHLPAWDRAVPES